MRSIRKTTSGKTPKASTTCGRRCGRVQSASCTRHQISRTGRAHTGPHAFGDNILRLAEAAGTQQGVLFWRVWGTTPTMILSFEARGILRELRTGRTAAIAKRTWSDQHVLAIATTLQQVQSIRAISKCNRSVVAIAGNDRAQEHPRTATTSNCNAFCQWDSRTNCRRGPNASHSRCLGSARRPFEWPCPRYCCPSIYSIKRSVII